MLISNTVYIDVAETDSNDSVAIKRNRIIGEMKDFGFEYDGWQKVQIKRNGMVASFTRISFTVPTHDAIVLPDTYVSALGGRLALVKLPRNDSPETSQFEEIYLSAREYLHTDPLLDKN